jgi:hypothetical protein
MTITTQHAIRAARSWRSWGRYATIRYLQRRGVPLRLYYLARQLEALEGAVL